jgi:hypothetical protein
VTRKSTEEMITVIDTLAEYLDENVLNSIKFLLVAQDIDVARQEHPTFHDLDLLRKDVEQLELKITIRFGVLVAAGVGVLATLIKVL